MFACKLISDKEAGYKNYNKNYLQQMIYGLENHAISAQTCKVNLNSLN